MCQSKPNVCVYKIHNNFQYNIPTTHQRKVIFLQSSLFLFITITQLCKFHENNVFVYRVRKRKPELNNKLCLFTVYMHGSTIDWIVQIDLGLNETNQDRKLTDPTVSIQIRIRSLNMRHVITWVQHIFFWYTDMCVMYVRNGNVWHMENIYLIRIEIAGSYDCGIWIIAVISCTFYNKFFISINCHQLVHFSIQVFVWPNNSLLSL